MKTEYELSMYDGARKYICVSFFSPEALVENWSSHNKLMELHHCKNGKKIETAKANVDYIKVL